MVNPFKATPDGRVALASVLEDIRDQAGCVSWEEFAEKAASEAGLTLNPNNLKQYSPTPQYGSVPNPGLFYSIHSWGIFKFRGTQETITAESLYEVLLGIRSSTGELLERNARNP